ncbi:ADI_G0057990.mRNA.1.CDS.1 [Saccharomyces cerevisiae]|nr:AHG_G0051590.mRNA.1.CDS.1 [Saccharomyces cerevisiae]CAI4780788.1 BAK_1a_G0051100.mRNA.1.CDS.1 [Saccharomyces cerevisiae]CAI4783456.1 BDC_1c_G0051860.mRNA.1.CDS.1 [Saccharomyces cerevisiae]CAI4784129.1 AIC_G0051430.mRNA.1.CDS.1 [Saccharomyces cerevisiae]CAI4784514.1 CAS_1a_G0051600.mRNA.1.CDS.1 [Saccharomyces cerevisiae]
MSEKKKVLMLHGFVQSDKIFSAKTGGLRKNLKKLGYDLYYPCAPYSIDKKALFQSESEKGRDAAKEFNTSATSDEVYGWFFRNPESFNSFQIDQKVFNYLRNYVLENGPFDGVIGFSQGAGLGGYLVTDFNRILNLTDEQQPALKFFISFSGFKLEDQSYQKEYHRIIQVPSLHVRGELDEVVAESRIMALYESWPDNKRTLLVHPGAHFVPNSKPFVSQVCNWIQGITSKEGQEHNAQPEVDRKQFDKPQLEDDLLDMIDSLGKLTTGRCYKKVRMSTNTEIIKNSDLQSLINDKRRLINEIKDFNKSIKPLEFESYQDYFLIKTFKKGISASGHVDIDSLRNKEYGIYYKKIKRNSTQEVGEPIPRNTSSSSSSTRSNSSADISDTEYSGENTPTTTGAASRRRRTRSRAIQRENSLPASLPSISEANANNDDVTISEINGSELPFPIPISEVENIDIASDITERDGIRRRSSRISERDKRRSQSRLGSEEDEEGDGHDGDEGETKIQDLYESLVPKILEPRRRSDWILPPKARYTPEKQMRTKPSFKSIKINELVGNKRIRSILSRFEGGVAGIRKRDWDSTQ